MIFNSRAYVCCLCFSFTTAWSWTKGNNADMSDGTTNADIKLTIDDVIDDVTDDVTISTIPINSKEFFSTINDKWNIIGL